MNAPCNAIAGGLFCVQVPLNGQREARAKMREARGKRALVRKSCARRARKCARRAGLCNCQIASRGRAAVRVRVAICHFAA